MKLNQKVEAGPESIERDPKQWLSAVLMVIVWIYIILLQWQVQELRSQALAQQDRLSSMTDELLRVASTDRALISAGKDLASAQSTTTDLLNRHSRMFGQVANGLNQHSEAIIKLAGSKP